MSGCCCYLVICMKETWRCLCSLFRWCVVICTDNYGRQCLPPHPLPPPYSFLKTPLYFDGIVVPCRCFIIMVFLFLSWKQFNDSYIVMIFVTFSSKTDIFYYRDMRESCLFLEFVLFSENLFNKIADNIQPWDLKHGKLLNVLLS